MVVSKYAVRERFGGISKMQKVRDEMVSKYAGSEICVGT